MTDAPRSRSLVALCGAAALVAVGLARAPRGLYTPWTPDDIVLPAGQPPSPRLWLCIGGTRDTLRDVLDVPGATLYTCRDGAVVPIEDAQSDGVRWVTPVLPRGGGPELCPPEPCPPLAPAGRGQGDR